MSLEGAKAVTNITGSLYQIYMILQYAAQTRQLEGPAESLNIEIQLKDSIREGIRRIHEEYNQALSKIGSPLSDGDESANFAIQSAHVGLKAILGTIHSQVQHGGTVFTANSLRDWHSGIFKATKETVLSIDQLQQRKLQQTIVPTSLKWDHPWFREIETVPLRFVKVGKGLFNSRQATYEGTKGPGALPQLHGKGLWIHKDGESYFGGWKDNKRHGYGEARFESGGSYNGDWENNMKNGYGEYTWNNGDKYSGQWRNNKRCGAGVISSHGRVVYRGGWESDKYDGVGVLILQTGQRIEGVFQAGSLEGFAVVTWPSGNYYVGQFRRGRRDGFGVGLAEDGMWYDGEWKDSNKHGFGQTVLPSGEKLQGQWASGQRC